MNEPWTKTVVSEQFVASLLAAADEPAMRALVEERANLVRTLAGKTHPAKPRRNAAAVAGSTPGIGHQPVGRQEFRGSDYLRRRSEP